MPHYLAIGEPAAGPRKPLGARLKDRKGNNLYKIPTWIGESGSVATESYPCDNPILGCYW